MGYHLVGEVLGFAPDLPCREFRILVALALDATDSTRLAKPGRELLALHGNCSMRTARRAVGRLEARGYVKVVGHPGPGRRTVYAILPMPGTPASEVACERRPRTVASERRPRTVATDPQPPEEPNGGQLAPNGGHLSAERRPLTVAPPEPNTGTLDLNPSKSSRRTTRTGSSGPAAATDDLDFALRTTSDPREMLARLGLTADQTEPILKLIARYTADPAGYLRSKSGDPEAFMRWALGQLADPDAGGLP
jgi:hypothetical protein